MTRFLYTVLLGIFLFGFVTPVLAAPGPIIINHTTTDITKIPDAWITAVKSDTKGIDFAYTSHGAYIISGLKAWEYYDSRYAFDYTDDGSNHIPTGTKLKIGARNGYDWYYDYWSGSSGIAATEDALNTGNFKYSMFEWCTELSTWSTSQVDAYLAQMEAFEAGYPAIRFIYTTQHADAGATDGGTKAISNNARIRSYAIAHNKILYDYEAIGSHSPGGTDYLNDGCGVGYVYSYADECTYDGGNWCTAWKLSNPGDVFTTVANDLVAIDPSGCYHSPGGLQGTMKGAAFWWMMARLAGWDGTTSTGPPAPQVFSVTPDSGMSGRTLAITDLSGSGFDDGALVRLTRTGSPGITMTESIITPQKITGTFDLTGTVAGLYNVEVTNPDGQSGTLANGFLVTLPPPAPVAAFSGTPVTGSAPLVVTFTDGSTGTSITSRRWDFGDGNISNYVVSTNPVHRYTSTGTYSVNLTVTNAGGSDSLMRANYISVSAPPASPVALFTGIPLSGTTPLDVTFTDSSTGTSITSRRWDFGDGNISNYAVSTNPVHRYTSAGTYSVNLTVTNASGSSSLRRTNYITATPAPVAPVAGFTTNVQTGFVPLEVQFSDQSTGTGPLTLAWDFTNDGTVDSNAREPLYTYSAPGTYTVKLTATNDVGSDDEIKTGFIVVNPVPAVPIADFTGLPLFGNAPLEVMFTDSSTGTSITNRRWDFGDGAISVYDVNTNPVHIYTRAGTYNVRLTVTNAGGFTSLNRPGYITVTDNLLTNTLIQIGVFRNSSGSWYLDTTGTGIVTMAFQFGKSEDIPVVGDWDGDGTSDVGVFRPSSGTWGLDFNKDEVTDRSFHFGKSGDIPVVADWDGDGTSDVGVFRPSSGTWGLNFNKDEVTDRSFHFGKSGDIPVVADWDGDRTSDVGVFRPSIGEWYLDTNRDSVVDIAFHFGKSGDIPVVGDWDDDGTSDPGVFRPSTGSWYMDTTRTGIVDKAIRFGKSGDFPQAGVWN